MKKFSRLEKLILDKSNVCRDDSFSFNEETNLITDLCFDSLSLISLLIAIETEYNIQMDIDIGFEEMTRFGALKEYISKKLDCS